MSTEQPLTCDLTAIEDSEREKHKDTSEEVFPQRDELEIAFRRIRFSPPHGNWHH